MPTVSSSPSSRLTSYGINTIARHTFLAVMTDALIFGGAGTLNWKVGWFFSIIYFMGWGVLNGILALWNPTILNERGKRSSQLTGTKAWDWWLLGIYSVLIIIQPLLAGLDKREGWSPDPQIWLIITGNVLIIIHFALLTWSMCTNDFFEGTVRIQAQRGHYVINSGPYRYVRHPGYVAVILSFVGLPLALGTWYALIPGMIGVAVYIIRTYLEDTTLQRELPGYQEYTQRTHFRLFPGLW
jgi:protein-S-isoprenylcysteine O-methyltransferase Ste14